MIAYFSASKGRPSPGSSRRRAGYSMVSTGSSRGAEEGARFHRCLRDDRKAPSGLSDWDLGKTVRALKLPFGAGQIYLVSMNTPRRTFLSMLASAFGSRPARSENQPMSGSIIDDLSRESPMATIGTSWRLFTDTVMGGVSRATMDRETLEGRPAIRLRGQVSLENNGGFVQISLDFRPDDGSMDASSWSGIEVDVFGNGEEYAVNLRTTDLTRPWQSYRQTFRANPRWETVRLPFERFVPNRTDIPLDIRRLRRIGIIGIGRQFFADVSIGGVRFFR